jgi:DNA polymerase
VIILGDKILKFEKCNGCKLFSNPECSQIVHGFGNIKSDIVFIGEGPDYNENKDGYPFVGKSGKMLRTNINAFMGISDNDIFYTNVVRCHPPKNRNPEQDELDSCQKYWLEEIAQIKPKIIVCVGNFAAKTVIGKSFTKISIDRRKIFSNDLCKVIVPIIHPSSIRGSEAEKIAKEADFKLDIQIVRSIYDKSKSLPRSTIEIKTEKTFDF